MQDETTQAARVLAASMSQFDSACQRRKLGPNDHMLALHPQQIRLDIAVAAGHTAFAPAEHVSSVIANNVTAEMLAVAQKPASDRGINNESYAEADAHTLGFDGASFDVVACRIATPHFSDPAQCVPEPARLLRPSGVSGLVDNLAPEDPAAVIWRDDFERRRDLGHRRCLPTSEWSTLIKDPGLTITAFETSSSAVSAIGMRP